MLYLLHITSTTQQFLPYAVQQVFVVLYYRDLAHQLACYQPKNGKQGVGLAVHWQ